MKFNKLRWFKISINSYPKSSKRTKRIKIRNISFKALKIKGSSIQHLKKKAFFRKHIYNFNRRSFKKSRLFKRFKLKIRRTLKFKTRKQKKKRFSRRLIRRKKILKLFYGKRKKKKMFKFFFFKRKRSFFYTLHNFFFPLTKKSNYTAFAIAPAGMGINKLKKFDSVLTYRRKKEQKEFLNRVKRGVRKLIYGVKEKKKLIRKVQPFFYKKSFYFNYTRSLIEPKRDYRPYFVILKNGEKKFFDDRQEFIAYLIKDYIVLNSDFKKKYGHYFNKMYKSKKNNLKTLPFSNFDHKSLNNYMFDISPNIVEFQVKEAANNLDFIDHVIKRDLKRLGVLPLSKKGDKRYTDSLPRIALTLIKSHFDIFETYAKSYLSGKIRNLNRKKRNFLKKIIKEHRQNYIKYLSICEKSSKNKKSLKHLINFYYKQLVKDELNKIKGNSTTNEDDLPFLTVEKLTSYLMDLKRKIISFNARSSTIAIPSVNKKLSRKKIKFLNFYLNKNLKIFLKKDFPDYKTFSKLIRKAIFRKTKRDFMEKIKDKLILRKFYKKFLKINLNHPTFIKSVMDYVVGTSVYNREIFFVRSCYTLNSYAKLAITKKRRINSLKPVKLMFKKYLKRMYVARAIRRKLDRITGAEIHKFKRAARKHAYLKRKLWILNNTPIIKLKPISDKLIERFRRDYLKFRTEAVERLKQINLLMDVHYPDGVKKLDTSKKRSYVYKMVKTKRDGHQPKILFTELTENRRSSNDNPIYKNFLQSIKMNNLRPVPREYPTFPIPPADKDFLGKTKDEKLKMIKVYSSKLATFKKELRKSLEMNFPQEYNQYLKQTNPAPLELIHDSDYYYRLSKSPQLLYLYNISSILDKHRKLNIILDKEAKNIEEYSSFFQQDTSSKILTSRFRLKNYISLKKKILIGKNNIQNDLCKFTNDTINMLPDGEETMTGQSYEKIDTQDEIGYLLMDYANDYISNYAWIPSVPFTKHKLLLISVRLFLMQNLLKMYNVLDDRFVIEKHQSREDKFYNLFPSSDKIKFLNSYNFVKLIIKKSRKKLIGSNLVMRFTSKVALFVRIAKIANISLNYCRPEPELRVDVEDMIHAIMQDTKADRKFYTKLFKEQERLLPDVHDLDLPSLKKITDDKLSNYVFESVVYKDFQKKRLQDFSTNFSTWQDRAFTFRGDFNRKLRNLRRFFNNSKHLRQSKRNSRIEKTYFGLKNATNSSVRGVKHNLESKIRAFKYDFMTRDKSHIPAYSYVKYFEARSRIPLKLKDRIFFRSYRKRKIKRFKLVVKRLIKSYKRKEDFQRIKLFKSRKPKRPASEHHKYFMKIVKLNKFNKSYNKSLKTNATSVNKFFNLMAGRSCKSSLNFKRQILFKFKLFPGYFYIFSTHFLFDDFAKKRKSKIRASSPAKSDKIFAHNLKKSIKIRRERALFDRIANEIYKPRKTIQHYRNVTNKFFDALF